MRPHLSPKQLTAIAHGGGDDRLYAAVGAVRSGKSVACVLAHAAFSLVNPDYDHAIIGVTETAVRRNLTDGYLDAFLAFGLNARLAMSGGTHIHIPMPGGRLPLRIWIFGAADSASAVERMRGSTWGSMMVDELTGIPAEIWSMAWSRLTPPGARAWATMNPKGVTHWARGVVEGSPRTRVVHFSMLDNPGLSDEARERIASGLSGHDYKRLVLGEWADAAGLIWPHWRRGELTRAPKRWTAGIDWASSGVFAAVLIGETEEGSADVVTAELRHDGQTEGVLTDTEHADRFAAWVQAHTEGIPPGTLRIAGDPATSAGFQRALKERGYRWRDGDNRVLKGLQSVCARLERGELRIADALVELPREIAGYGWDPRSAEKGEDRPVKRDDHLCDALRYGSVRGSPPRELGAIGF